jgi:hypothetical protein
MTIIDVPDVPAPAEQLCYKQKIGLTPDLPVDGQVTPMARCLLKAGHGGSAIDELHSWELQDEIYRLHGFLKAAGVLVRRGLVRRV